MRLMQRLAGPVLLALFAALLPVHGQTPGSPIEQILQGLSPEQISAISQQLGGVGGTQGAPAGLSRQLPQTEEQQSLLLQQQRQQLIDQKKQGAELERLSPFLQADDWVVITIDTRPLPGNAPTAPPGAQGAPAGAAGQQPQNILGNLTPPIAGTQGQSVKIGRAPF